MARIRTIKPEFWSSPDTASCEDPWERLLFIAMWNWADDMGRGTAIPKELAGFAFPNDEKIDSAEIRRMLGGIRRAFGVVFYEVAGRPYYAIPSWDRHQKIDKRSGGKFPGPEEGTDWDPDPDGGSDQRRLLSSEGAAEPSEEPAEPTPSPRRTLGAGTGEQGNRGTGEKEDPPAPANVTTDRAHTRSGGGERTTAQELNRTAQTPTGYRIIAAWASEQHGLTTGRRRELAKAVDELLAQRADPTLIPAALDRAHGPDWRHPIKALPIAYDQIRRGAHTSTPAPVPTDPEAQLADIRDRLDVSTAARLVGVAWIEPAQHPDDETPFSDWYRTQREAFIDQHATQIITAITERARRAG